MVVAILKFETDEHANKIDRSFVHSADELAKEYLIEMRN